MPDRCRSCKAPVYWVTHESTGRRAIVDLEPTAKGNLLALAGNKVRVLTDAARQEHIDAGGLLYLDHHATCPQAKDWKRR